MLESQVSNWETITQILADEHLRAVIVKLTTYTYSLITRPHYDTAARKLFASLKSVPHIVFVHETILTGIDPGEPDEPESDYRWGKHSFDLPDPITRTKVNALMDEYELNVVPYEKNAELTAMALTFIDQNEKNLIFRIYVPEGRMWSAESEKVLHLFRDYLTKVSGLKVRQDQYKTNQGTVYELFSDQVLAPTTLPAEFNDFSNFLDLCLTEPQHAAQLLDQKSVNHRIIDEIVDRYAKEAKRLHVDLKHERERKLLSIRHRMESELVDIVPTSSDWTSLNQLIDSLVPTVGGISSVLGLNALHAAHTPTHLTLNFKPQIISQVKGFVAQEVSGNQHFGAEATGLLKLIDEHAGAKKAELVSAVQEVEDADTDSGDRLTAAQKLKSFLFKVGEKVTDVGFDLLTSYIEKKIGL